MEATRSMKGRRRGGNGKKSVTKSTKAELLFPVGRIACLLKNGQYAERVRSDAFVYMAAVLEYLVAEVLEMAGRAARDNEMARIIPRHLLLVVKFDMELDELLSGVTISSCGVIRNIHSALFCKKDERTNTTDSSDTTGSSQKSQKSPKKA